MLQFNSLVNISRVHRPSAPAENLQILAPKDSSYSALRTVHIKT